MIRRLLTSALPPLLVFFAVSTALELTIRVQHIAQYILPLPSSVAMAFFTHGTELLRATWYTALAAVIGFSASIIVGMSTAVVLASSNWLRRAIYPYTLFFQTVPIVAIAPLLVLWVSAGLVSVSISAFIVSVFPVIANTLSGLLGTDPALVDLFELYGAGPVDRLVKLRLPFALPSIISGLRVSAGLAVIGTVVGEFLVDTLGDTEGLGVKIAGAKKYGNLDVVFAAVLLASLLGLAFFSLVNLFGHITLHRWHASERSS